MKGSLVLVLGSLVMAQSPGTFTATGNMITERNGHTATLLNNGKVLIAGGSVNASAELYDPTMGIFTATGNMTTARFSSTATLRPNGKVLIAGGNANNSTPLGLASAELYDPSSGTFAATANMTAARVWHTATLLNDGKVLIAGGQNRDGALASAELYDPSAETFTPTGKMAVVRSGQFATLFSSGKVLIAQHLDGSSGRTEVYDPDTGVFSDTIAWKNSVDINGVSESVGAPTVSSLTNGKILVTLETQGCVFPVANA
jgi:outer membrane protein assembly factor BamB